MLPTAAYPFSSRKIVREAYVADGMYEVVLGEEEGFAAPKPQGEAFSDPDPNSPPCSSTVHEKMAIPEDVAVDAEGRLHSTCLHWEGCPAILWDVLRAAGYTSTPHYIAREYVDHGMPCCHVRMSVAAHPLHPEWEPLVVDTYGYRTTDTWESAAVEALSLFYGQHQEEPTVAALQEPLTYPVEDPLREYEAHMLVATSLHRLHSIERDSLTEVIRVPQTSKTQLTDSRLEAIQLAVEVANRDIQVAQLEAWVGQLQEQVHDQESVINALLQDMDDLHVEIYDANEHIDLHHHQHQELEAQIQAMDEDEEEDPKEVQGGSGIDFEDVPPLPSQQGP